MLELINSFYLILQSPHFLITAIFISFATKIYFLTYLVPLGFRLPKIQKPWIFAMGVLVGSMFGDIAWGVKLGREIFLPSSPYDPVTFFIRIAWGFLIIQYHCLGLFIESLTEKNYDFKIFQKFLLVISCCLSLYFFSIAFFNTTFTSEQARAFVFYSADNLFMGVPFEAKVMRGTVFYILFCLILPSFYFALKRISSVFLPKILQKQLKIFLLYLVVPYLAIEFLEAMTLIFSFLQYYMYAIVGVSTILLTCAIFYCAIKVIRLRFLNHERPITNSSGFNFLNDFTTVLEQFGHATSLKELEAITKAFFKEAFKVPLSQTTLIIRKNVQSSGECGDVREAIIERFMADHSESVDNLVKKLKILISDEIALTEFYEEDKANVKILNFLSEINAGIFLPIFDRQLPIAYIIIERGARVNPENFFSRVEREEMLVLASYLEKIINLLQRRNIHTIVQQEKDLKQELYNKHQEINQYKESIRAFLRNNKTNEVGIIFYKNGRLAGGNPTAKILAPYIFTQEDSSLGAALKQLATQVEAYKSPQTMHYKLLEERFMIIALPNIDQQSVVLALYREDLASIVKHQVDLLKDPTDWDYILYLETTKSGQLINNLVPGNGQTLLQFKIDLLKTSLRSQATLLEMAEEDLVPIVELLHHITLREKLHILTLQGPAKNFDIAVTLFGINPIFGINKQAPLLAQLDKVGTLFIQNIHNLDIESQHYLAEFIKYGWYRTFKSDQKNQSDVRVVCSTTQNLQVLVQEGKFSKELFNELRAMTIAMPSLLTLPEVELYELAHGFSQQCAQKNNDLHLVELSEKDKKIIGYNRPVSLKEFKNKIELLVDHKAKKKSAYYDETQFATDFDRIGPELIQAAKMGKQALKDPKVMAMLWNKFRNQNKIATFLGVNRSSVNRRCKDYELMN